MHNGRHPHPLTLDRRLYATSFVLLLSLFAGGDPFHSLCDAHKQNTETDENTNGNTTITLALVDDSDLTFLRARPLTSKHLNQAKRISSQRLALGDYSS